MRGEQRKGQEVAPMAATWERWVIVPKVAAEHAVDHEVACHRVEGERALLQFNVLDVSHAAVDKMETIPAIAIVVHGKDRVVDLQLTRSFLMHLAGWKSRRVRVKRTGLCILIDYNAVVVRTVKVDEMVCSVALHTIQQQKRLTCVGAAKHIFDFLCPDIARDHEKCGHTGPIHVPIRGRAARTHAAAVRVQCDCRDARAAQDRAQNERIGEKHGGVAYRDELVRMADRRFLVPARRTAVVRAVHLAVERDDGVSPLARAHVLVPR
ncbi:hypothetical protein FI667_g1025, partial [Globisporangium splendens]